MGLYKRNGIYWYDFTVRGRRVRGSTDQRDKYMAGLVMNDRMSQARNKGLESILRESPFLKDFAVEFEKWVEETHSLESATRRYYKNGWRLLKVTPLAVKRLDEIKNHDCETIAFPGSNANANTALRTLRRMFAKAKELQQFWGELPEIKLRKEWARSVAMTEENAIAIAAKMDDGDAKDALLILRPTGMRPKECFSMRWEFVNWQGGYRNPSGKTPSARRIVPLLGDSLAILKRRHIAQGEPSQGWVFPASSECGHMVTIHKPFTKARKAAGMPDSMVLYTARHGAGTDLGSRLDLKTTMEILGHSDAKTALKYQHPSVEEVRDKLEAAKTTGRIQ